MMNRRANKLCREKNKPLGDETLHKRTATSTPTGSTPKAHLHNVRTVQVVHAVGADDASLAARHATFRILRKEAIRVEVRFHDGHEFGQVVPLHLAALVVEVKPHIPHQSGTRLLCETAETGK